MPFKFSLRHSTQPLTHIYTLEYCGCMPHMLICLYYTLLFKYFIYVFAKGQGERESAGSWIGNGGAETFSMCSCYGIAGTLNDVPKHLFLICLFQALVWQCTTSITAFYLRYVSINFSCLKKLLLVTEMTEAK